MAQHQERLHVLLSRRRELSTFVQNVNQRIRIGTALNRKIMYCYGKDDDLLCRLEDPDLINSQTVDLAVLASKMGELRNIELVIRRIESGQERHCVDCGRKIPAKRLEARLDTVRCISCQEEEEEARKSRRTRTAPCLFNNDD